jgi:dihydroneopterin aldolase
MAVSSKLLEHVGGRIANRIKNEFPQITSIELTIDKENPPMGAECLAAGIDIKIEY